MSRFLITCGGTGGHLSPGIALAEGLIGRGHEATLLISHKKVDARLIAKYPQLHFERIPAAPFTLLGRTATAGSEEEWGVRGWQPDMGAWLTAQGATLREVIDLDLEESFVELLSSARTGGAA